MKNCAPFTKCISRLSNAQVDDAHDVDVVIPMYNLIEHNDNYSKTSGILWEYCRDELALDDKGTIVDFTTVDNIINSFKIKEKITGRQATMVQKVFKEWYH